MTDVVALVSMFILGALFMLFVICIIVLYLADHMEDADVIDNKKGD